MSDKKHIVVVEDDRSIAILVEKALTVAGFRVSVALDGKAMDRIVKHSQPDLVLLDLMLPGESGLDIARRISSATQWPLIIMTALGEEMDRVLGLELGADDYVVKPFSSRELIARIRAVLRRARPDHIPRKVRLRNYRFDRWVLDGTLKELRDDEGVKLMLTSAEHRLLQVFCDHPRQILKREHLLELTQGQFFESDDRSIDTLISRIRRKIEEDQKYPKIIQTVRMGGYFFAPEVFAL